MAVILSVITFLVVLSTLILIHEAGHFFAARRFGVWVEEFGWGLPPRAWGKKIGETIYSINWLPFGGFVRLHGESFEDGVTKPEAAFINKSKKVRTVIISAGVFMNLVLALVIFSVVYTVSGVPQEVPTGRVKVLEIAPDSPARDAGLAPQDIVRKVEGKEVASAEEFINIIETSRGKKITLEVERKKSEGETELVTLTPQLKDIPAREGALGVSISSIDLETYFPPIWQRPFYGIFYGFKEAIFWGKAVISGLGSLVTDLVSKKAPVDIAGPVGIYQINTQVCSIGFLQCLNFLGVLSVNLAVMNFLPIPALDGGRLLFIAIEAIFRRRVTPQIEGTIHAVGMIALLLFIVVISFFDFKRLAAEGQLPGFLLQLFK